MAFSYSLVRTDGSCPRGYWPCLFCNILGRSGETPAMFYSTTDRECGCTMPVEELCRAAVLGMGRLGTRCSAAAFEAPVRANAAN